MHRAHDAGEHRSVADPGVEQAYRGGRGWMLASSIPTRWRDHPFLAAGADEQQILLAVVV